MKRNILLNVLLVAAVLILPACAKVGFKDPVILPGVEETFEPVVEKPPLPKFSNGDVVRYKMLRDRRGIMICSNYEYKPQLETWYCVVDFYPSSALIHLDFYEFDNYERRYVYEFELELVRKYSKYNEYAKKRWAW
ncbi:MAG: hypothetical protein ACYS0C_00230 [Planctomycetota bacterium]